MEKRLTLMICVILLLYFCMVSCDSNPSGIDSQDLVEEKQLQTEHTSKEILDNAVALFSDDFDSNGKEEAFVLLEPESNNYIGSDLGERFAELWFYDGESFEKIADETYYLPQGSIQLFGSSKVLLLEEYYTTGSFTHFWSVENGVPYEHSISGKGGDYQKEEQLLGTLYDKNVSVFSLLDSKYDAAESDGMLLGHTWKRYYFSWDSNHHTFIEFGGISLTEEQFSHCKNAEEVRAYISEKKGVITEIYYRDCGIVHVNYSVQSSPDDTHYYGITLRLIDQAVYFVSTYEGTYQNAMISEIAIFPDQIPSFMLTTAESEV